MAARESGEDPYDVLDEMMGWERFVASVAEAEGLALPANFDYLDFLEAGHAHVRRYATALLEAFDFKAAPSAEPLIEAVSVLKEMNRMRDAYEYRRRFAARVAGQPEEGEEDGDYEERSLSYQRFRRELLSAEREALIQLQNQGHLSDEARSHRGRSRPTPLGSAPSRWVPMAESSLILS